jgi:hypothetical protein
VASRSGGAAQAGGFCGGDVEAGLFVADAELGADLAERVACGAEFGGALPALVRVHGLIVRGAKSHPQVEV